MSGETRVFIAELESEQLLREFEEKVILRLNVRDDVGNYLIIGKVILTNQDGDYQDARARLTTLEGKTNLDRADVRIGPYNEPSVGAQEISLQATMSLPSSYTSPYVELRCSTFAGSAQHAKLYAVQVDDIQRAGV